MLYAFDSLRAKTIHNVTDGDDAPISGAALHQLTTSPARSVLLPTGLVLLEVSVAIVSDYQVRIPKWVGK